MEERRVESGQPVAAMAAPKLAHAAQSERVS